ncbi:BlaI/MecI/CopY family transcriptional regulator [Saccharomonospora glauca]|uniref:BlaI/MecI/CopY family transcriptional regulator n=1 Tax=Saccharomonospora glauca TaxID=40990 RepID=UPI000593CF56|nr:BlaI/MecI/CopY family transcriptional regulator [Saccharomonospora glauca]
MDVARLGELERAVMEVLWARDEPLSVRAVHAALGDRGLAYTTVMTVLTRLANKGVVRRSRQGRAWLYRPAAGREAYVAELMLEALELSGDRGSALVHFANSVTSDEADALRKALLRGESAPEAERQGEQT